MENLDTGLLLTVYRPQVPLDPKYPLPALPGILRHYNELVVVGTFSGKRGERVVPLDPLYQEVPVSKERPPVVLTPTGLMPLVFFDQDSGKQSLPPHYFTCMMSGIYAGSLGIRWRLLTKQICGHRIDMLPVADALVPLEEWYEIDEAAEELNKEFREAEEALKKAGARTEAGVAGSR